MRCQNGKKWLLKSSFYSILLSVTFLVAFIALSVQAGIVAIGVPDAYSIPNDYLQLGFNGWMILAVGALGMLSPGIAAWLADS